MPLNKDVTIAISIIEKWYKEKCNGLWEHRWGVKLETTDNPGWLFTFNYTIVSEDTISKTASVVFREFRAQISTDGQTVEIFTHTLEQCLLSAACVIEISKKS